MQIIQSKLFPFIQELILTTIKFLTNLLQLNILLLFPFKITILQMFAAYNRALNKFPILTKMITSGTLFSIGDIITQKVLDKRQNFDYKRNFNLFVVGASYLAPMLHVWYCKMLPMIQKKIFSEKTAKATRVFTSMAFDQLLFAPVLLVGFFVYDGVVNDFSINGLQKGIQSYKQKIFQTLKYNWMIWPAASSINFWFMPVQYQVLFANIVGLFWNIILSYIAYDEKPQQVSKVESVV